MMQSEPLPQYYFRVRENGAAVFRVDTENRNQRIEMDQIAVINTNRGDYKAHGNRTLDKDDDAAIQTWLAQRLDVLAQRESDDVQRTIDQLNLTAQWAQSKANNVQLDDVTDGLLMAMHDLRSVLIRKRAEKLANGK